jgi:hypothetical protein
LTGDFFTFNKNTIPPLLLTFLKFKAMTNTTKFNRRQFLGLTGSAVAFTVVPRHVLGGINYVAPSDRITLGLIGCGTQQLRELTGLINDPRIEIVSVCDPVKNPAGYLDWSVNGVKNSLRRLLEDNSWGENIKGVPGGRDVGKDVVDRYYANKGVNQRRNGCTAYSDFNEMLDKEPDMTAVKIITPDHLHAIQAINSLKKGKHVIMHKPVANVVNEARRTVDIAKNTSLTTHLLAWSDRSSYALVKKWIDEGAIGKLREVHNWSYRPVWPQWTSNPSEKPPIPEGFDWGLWLGPVPDRPYHPDYTHTNYRGWYDFGAGSVADMGIYSLWQLFTTLGITTAPVSIEAFGTTTSKVNENHVCQGHRNTVAFPYSSIFRWKFPAFGSSPELDLFWYDGGMKPHTPPEVEADNMDLPTEGMMFVGDKGKIMGGFRCENPRIIPGKMMIDHTGAADPPKDETTGGTDVWIDAVLNNRQSPGNFQSASICNETALLAAVALRAGRKIIYDPVNMKVVNFPEADRFLYRQEYRKGWEI